jgi:hypothetical protein
MLARKMPTNQTTKKLSNLSNTANKKEHQQLIVAADILEKSIIID